MRGHGTAHRWRRVIGGLAIVAAIALSGYFWIWLPTRPADTSHLRVAVSDSDRFTRRQLDDAVAMLLDGKRDYHGCSIDAIVYDEARSDRLLALERETIESTPGSDSTVYSRGIARYGVEGMAVFSTDFTCGENAPSMGFSPGTTSGWYDYLAYDPDSPDADRGWVRIDSGW